MAETSITSLRTHLPGLQLDSDDMSHALVQQLDGHPEVGHCCEREVLLRGTREEGDVDQITIGPLRLDDKRDRTCSIEVVGRSSG
jgi:hypothetical protein